jgi:hypothetical protein
MPLSLPTFFIGPLNSAEAEDEFIEPAPDGDPPGVAVAFATQEAAELGDFAEKISGGFDRVRDASNLF